jgi:hypothetical protein
MQLYHHKTDGGAEYLMDAFIECPDGSKEGVFAGAKYIVRIDGDITKDAELTIADDSTFFPLPSMSVARADLNGLGFKADKLTDDEMTDIASNASDALMEGEGYWMAIEAAAEACGVKRSKTKPR